MSNLEEPATAIHPGIYSLQNFGSGSFLDMSMGSSANGNKVQGWHGLPADNAWQYDQLWLIQSLDDAQGGGYTIWNLRSGTYLELSNGSNENGAQAQGWARVTDNNDPNHQNQEWTFHRDADEPRFYQIINKRSGTALDLYYAAPDDGTKVQGWQAANPVSPNQLWGLLQYNGPGLGGIITP